MLGQQSHSILVTFPMFWYFLMCFVMFCDVLLRFAMFCYVLLCFVTFPCFCHVLQCFVLLCFAIFVFLWVLFGSGGLYSQDTDRGHPLVLVRIPVLLLFSFVSAWFSFVFTWISESVFLLTVSLDDSLTALVVKRRLYNPRTTEQNKRKPRKKKSTYRRPRVQKVTRLLF